MTGAASVGPAHAGREGEGEEWSGLLWAERGEGEELSPWGFIHFYFLFLFPSLSMHMFKWF